MSEDGAGPARPLRTWLPMTLWTAGILAALGLAWLVGAVAVPAWRRHQAGLLDSDRDIRIEQRWRLETRPQDERIPLGDEPLSSEAEPPRIVHRQGVSEQMLVTTDDEWRHIWAAYKRSTPKVDFNTHMVLGVYRLLAGAGPYDVHIKRIDKRDHGCVVYLDVQVLPPGYLGTCDIVGETAEYALIRRTDLPFVFVEDPYWISQSGVQIGR